MAIPYANPCTRTLELHRRTNSVTHYALHERACVEIRDCFPILRIDFSSPIELAVAEFVHEEYLAFPDP